MGRDRRPADELSIEELEALLARKRLEARQARLHQFQRTGRALRLPEEPPVSPQTNGQAAGAVEPSVTEAGAAAPAGRLRPFLNRLLLGVEVAAVLGFLYVLLSGVGALQQLNQEVAQALSGATASPTALITAIVLPSGHTPPTSPGGAQPNEAEIPENMRPLVQSLPVEVIPTPGPQPARSIFTLAIWNSAGPVVQGDGWEQRRRGVAQHLGTANPGEAGNLVLSAHNDIFGELFRDLDRLRPGDEIRVATSAREYLYRVTGLQIVEPTAVEVMLPTTRPTITLISCYPYLVDNQRIIVFGELAEG